MSLKKIDNQFLYVQIIESILCRSSFHLLSSFLKKKELQAIIYHELLASFVTMITSAKNQ